MENHGINRIPGVNTVLVVLSATGLVYDIEALRHVILLAYPGTVVFFKSTNGKPIGVLPVGKIDLLIDFTGPGQRQCSRLVRKFRRTAKMAVGRSVGRVRAKRYDRVFNEISMAFNFPDMLLRESMVQREVLALAGIPLVPCGDTPMDRSKSIARELPPLCGLSG
ncbi:MAG: hypothetical protein AABZ06_14465 [Bdellovibrionota bacterium]